MSDDQSQGTLCPSQESAARSCDYGFPVATGNYYVFGSDSGDKGSVIKELVGPEIQLG